MRILSRISILALLLAASGCLHNSCNAGEPVASVCPCGDVCPCGSACRCGLVERATPALAVLLPGQPPTRAQEVEKLGPPVGTATTTKVVTQTTFLVPVVIVRCHQRSFFHRHWFHPFNRRYVGGGCGC
jgi:hypothetical protein